MPEVNYAPDPIADHGRTYGGGLSFTRPSREATILLSHDQVRLLPTTPVQIVPQTEFINFLSRPTRVPVPYYLQLDWKSGTTAYGNLGGASDKIELFLGADLAAGPLTTGIIVGTLLGSPFQPLMNAGVVANNQFSMFGGMLDNGLYLGIVSGGAGNLTLGDAGNVIRAKVLYYLFNGQSGSFE